MSTAAGFLKKAQRFQMFWARLETMPKWLFIKSIDKIKTGSLENSADLVAQAANADFSIFLKTLKDLPLLTNCFVLGQEGGRLP